MHIHAGHVHILFLQIMLGWVGEIRQYLKCDHIITICPTGHTCQWDLHFMTDAFQKMNKTKFIESSFIKN